MADMDTDVGSSLPVKSEVDAHERVQVKLVDYTDPSLGQTVDLNGDAHVLAKMADENGDAFGTEANPIFVVPTEDPGIEVIQYATSSAVAKNGSVNHDYSVPANKLFRGASLIVSASGEFKVELQLEDAPASGTYETNVVAFAQASSPFVQIDLHKFLKQVAGAKVRIKITNRDNAQDLYSTLFGVNSAV